MPIGPCAPNDIAVLSFTLVNAATDADIGPLMNGAVIDLAVTPSISVRANVCQEANVQSVKFLLNANAFHTENLPFYTIAGDNNGNYLPWNIQPGVYTIRAIPYPADGGTGAAGTFYEVTITIINSGQPCQANDIKVTSFTLVNSATDLDIGPLVDGAVIDLAVTPQINIRANVCQENNIESVKFFLNGNAYHTENLLFYTIAGDNNGNYLPWNIQPGVYTIRATPYTGNGGTGTAGIYHEITITIINSTLPCQPNDIRVTSFTLVNAATDLDIGPLLNGAVIDLAVTPQINIRANVCQESNIESVKFFLNGNAYHTENLLFYTIAGDNNGNYLPWNIQPGVYTIRATPYTGNGGTGTAGIYHEITITIINSTLPCLSTDRKVVSFTLVSASSDADIGPLLNGAVINLAVTGSINVRADVCDEANVKSVKFMVNGNPFRTENSSPYALAGNSGPNYYPWNVQPGVYTIQAIPYSGINATGIQGTDLFVTITIIGSVSKRDEGEQLSVQPDENETVLKAYPNPFSDRLIIEFMVIEDTKATVEIFNVSGQRLATLFDGNVRASELYKAEFKPERVSSGVIIYKLRTEKETTYGKAVMVE